MNLESVLITNGIGVFLLLMLQYISKTRILRRSAEDRIYSFLIIGVLVGCCMEAASYFLDGKLFPGAILLNYIANTYLFTFNLLLPFSVMVYVDLGLYNDVSRIRRHYKPHIIIGLFMMVLNLVNFFTPIVYYISDLNIYERRPLSYIYYAVILFYCFTAMFVTHRYEKENGARAFLSVNAFLLPVLLGAGLQFLFYGLSLAWLASAIGLLGLYMMQQNETAYIDPLVVLYNRQYLNHIISGWISRGTGFAGVMLDIDHFKAVNDTYGHSEGDNALKTVANILRDSRHDNEWLFRFAGDEFIILKKTPDKDGLSDYLKEIDRRVDEYNRDDPPYPLSLSYGTSYYHSGSIDDFMKDMDRKMYAAKAAHHKAMSEA